LDAMARFRNVSKNFIMFGFDFYYTLYLVVEKMKGKETNCG